MGCQLWPAGPPYGLVSGLAQKKIGRADDCPSQWPRPWTWRTQNFKPCLLGIQLNPSILPGSSKPLEFVLTYSVPAPASVSSSIMDETEDLPMTHTDPIFLWKLLLTRSRKRYKGWCVATWIRWSSSQPTILSLCSIGTSGEPQESSDLAQEQVFVVPTSGYLTKVFTKSGSLKLLIPKHFSIPRPQKSFLL